MNPLSILNKYHDPDSETYRVLTTHSVLVAQLAIDIGVRLKSQPAPDLQFIYEATMLHDIGYRFPKAEEELDGRFKDLPRSLYVLHGFYGAELLRKEGLPKHARVAECHIGVGLPKEDIVSAGWPIPANDYLPETIEEKIIAYADLFYSKHPESLFKKGKKSAIREELGKFGDEKVRIFDSWDRLFDQLQ